MWGGAALRYSLPSHSQPESLHGQDQERRLQMVRVLVEGHEAVARTARKVFPLASKAGDEPTADFLTQRLTVHEQTAWSCSTP